MRTVLFERDVAAGVPSRETAGLGLEIVQRVFEREETPAEWSGGDRGAVGGCGFVVNFGVESAVIWGITAEGFEWVEQDERRLALPLIRPVGAPSPRKKRGEGDCGLKFGDCDPAQFHVVGDHHYEAAHGGFGGVDDEESFAVKIKWQGGERSAFDEAKRFHQRDDDVDEGALLSVDGSLPVHGWAFRDSMKGSVNEV